MAGTLTLNQIQLGDSSTAANNLVLRTNLDGTFTIARGNIGATTDDLVTIDANGNVSFPSSTYESPEQTITAAGLLTLAHGLGATPKFFTGYLVNKTAELGYSVGDKAVVNLQPFSDAGHFGLQVTNFDNANITVRYGSSALVVGNKTTGVATAVTPANWRFVLVARV